jgi:hypothetical protein
MPSVIATESTRRSSINSKISRAMRGTARPFSRRLSPGTPGAFFSADMERPPVRRIMRGCAVAVDFGAGKRASAACAGQAR